jgi:hypothetical protein
MSDLIFNNNAKWGRKPDQRKELVSYIINTYGMVITRKDLLSLVNANKCTYNDLTWIFVNKEFKSHRGQYTLASMVVSDSEATQTEQQTAGASI